MGFAVLSSENVRRSLIVSAVLLACSAAGCRKLLQKKDDGSSTSAPPSTGVIPASNTTADVAFAGSYTKTASVTMKGGRRVPSATNTGQATLTVRGGKVVWAQTYVAGAQAGRRLATRSAHHGQQRRNRRRRVQVARDIVLLLHSARSVQFRAHRACARARGSTSTR
jgi:hypothetical protein